MQVMKYYFFLTDNFRQGNSKMNLNFSKVALICREATAVFLTDLNYSDDDWSEISCVSERTYHFFSSLRLSSAIHLQAVGVLLKTKMQYLFLSLINDYIFERIFLK